MKNKIIISFVVVVLVFAGAVLIGKNYVPRENFTDTSNTAEQVNAIQPIAPVEPIYVLIPNSDLIAHLVSDPDFVPDELSQPSFLLSIEKQDGSIYKQIKDPSTTFLMYASDGTYVYVGGRKPSVQASVIRIKIETGKYEEYKFGSIQPEGYAEQISFSDNGRYMAYIDMIYGPYNNSGSYFSVEKGILYVYDFKTKQTKNVATFSQSGVNYQWKGNTLVYNNSNGEQSMRFGPPEMPASEYIKIAEPLVHKSLEKSFIVEGGILDYKIYQIDFVANRQSKLSDKYYVGSFYNPDGVSAFIVRVDYSIKCTDEALMYHCFAGNGERGLDGWINHKSLYFKVDKDASGYYATMMGTGL